MISLSRILQSGLLLLALGITQNLYSPSALAQDPSQASGVAEAGPGLTDLRPLSKDTLSGLAGGTALDTLSLATNTSTVTGNTIGDIGQSGAIGSNSLSGTNGLTTFIANSGNQVVISQSTVVNVYLH